MNLALIYDPALSAYRFPAGHPMRPERFTLAVDLIHAWGLVCEEASHCPKTTAEGEPAPTLRPVSASVDDLLLIHDPDYVAHVMALDEDPELADGSFGIGPGDTPAFPGIHQASALAVGASILALRQVVSGDVRKTFSPAGGLHHARSGQASGFCVYNDCAVAIERATLENPGLRVAYVDIDAHHGDGVEAAFYDRADVLTISVHESGRYLFPGTGFERDIGEGPGTGYALNVPLPPMAGRDQYLSVMEQVVAPALHAFGPDVIFAQLGADTHRDDPLTQLGLTIRGYTETVRMLIDIAEEVCDGRIAATGGGGYEPFFTVPRMWAGAFALLGGFAIPEELPESWLRLAAQAAGLAQPPVLGTFEEREAAPADGEADGGADGETDEAVRLLTDRAIAQAKHFSPLLAED